MASPISVAIFDPAAQMGRVVSARIEALVLAELNEKFGDALTVIAKEDVRMNPADDDQSSLFFVVERSRTTVTEGSPTATRYYSLSDVVSGFLLEQQEESLAEDGELLRFALSSCGVDAGLNPYVSFFQKLRPLENENALLRAALGFGKKDVVDLSSVRKRLSQRSAPQEASAVSHRSRQTVSVASRMIDDSTQTPLANDDSHRQSSGPGQTQHSLADPFSIHSPHLWEMETDAAINARTKYQPYREHSPSGRKLDLVTQQHLVVRLHDKSVDLLRYRRSERAKLIDPSEKKSLTSEEQTELGVRLHDQQRLHSAKIIEELSVKFKPNTSPKRVLSNEELKASTERIYKEPMERKRANLEKLLQRYIFDEEEKTPKVKLTAEQQKVIGERLCKK